MTFKKWDLAWAGLDPSVGHEQAGRRPVLVLSDDVISGAIGLVAIIPLTSWKEGRRVYPTEVLLPIEATSLPAISLALCHQLRTVSSRRLSASKARRLTDPKLRERIERGVKLWLQFL